jgi:molybdenum cofactor cytidylyltransferase
MMFGAVAVRDAVGAVLAHTLRAGDRVLKKGRVLSASDIEALAASGHSEVVCARLDPGELAEDAAAARVATALAGAGTRLERTHTGRTNLHAVVDGLVVVDAAAIGRANAIDEAITVATVPALAPARAGEMVATVKIIPFATREAAVEAAVEAVRGAVAIQPWRGCRGGLVLTRFTGTPPVLLDRAAAAQRTRMLRCGGALVGELRVAHDAAEVADAIGRLAAGGLDPILVLGA